MPVATGKAAAVMEEPVAETGGAPEAAPAADTIPETAAAAETAPETAAPASEPASTPAPEVRQNNSMMSRDIPNPPVANRDRTRSISRLRSPDTDHGCHHVQTATPTASDPGAPTPVADDAPAPPAPDADPVADAPATASADEPAPVAADAAPETAPTPEPTPEPVKAMTPTPITGTKAAPKTRGERRAELVEATNRVKEELKTATDTKSVEERKARLLARLERNESLEVAVEVALIDKDPQLVTEVLQQTSNVVAASEALAALYRSDENRAAEVLMGLDAARGAEYLRLMVDQLNDADAASALVGAEEPGRVVAVAQFLLPYGARSVLYKGKELLALVAATSPEAAKTIYAGLEYTEQVSILRRLVLGLGQRPGSEDKEEGALSRTALVDAAAFGASKPDFDTAASLLSGMEAKKATEVLHRFRTRGVKSGSEKWQRRQDAVEEVQKVLSAKNASLAADVAGLLAKKKK